MEWFKRAKGDLIIASIPLRDELVYDDLCYRLQQSVEKSLKALLMYLNEEIIRTHNIEFLLQMLEDKGIVITEYVMRTVNFTNYVSMRYPGEAYEIQKDEYDESLMLTKKCLEWVSTYLNEHNFVLT
jgi:HEPN domain-containing protein